MAEPLRSLQLLEHACDLLCQDVKSARLSSVYVLNKLQDVQNELRVLAVSLNPEQVCYSVPDCQASTPDRSPLDSAGTSLIHVEPVAVAALDSLSQDDADLTAHETFPAAWREEQQAVTSTNIPCPPREDDRALIPVVESPAELSNAIADISDTPSSRLSYPRHCLTDYQHCNSTSWESMDQYPMDSDVMELMLFPEIQSPENTVSHYLSTNGEDHDLQSTVLSDACSPRSDDRHIEQVADANNQRRNRYSCRTTADSGLMETSDHTLPHQDTNSVQASMITARRSPLAQHKTTVSCANVSTSHTSDVGTDSTIRGNDFDGVAVIDHQSILPHPSIVLDIFTQRVRHNSSDKALLLTRLFYYIGSPSAFCQLRHALKAARKAVLPTIEGSSHTLASTMQTLDLLGSVGGYTHILRRVLLVRLLELRNQREHHHRNTTLGAPPQRRLRKFDLERIDVIMNGAEVGASSAPRRQEHMLRKDRAASRALTDVVAMLEAPVMDGRGQGCVSNSDRDDSRTVRSEGSMRKKDKLRHRLWCARNWYRLSQSFSAGILALIPRGGETHISTDQVEKLSSADMELLVHHLERHRGPFLRDVSQLLGQHVYTIFEKPGSQDCQLALEVVHEGEVIKKSCDSPALAQLCCLVKT